MRLAAVAGEMFRLRHASNLLLLTVLVLAETVRVVLAADTHHAGYPRAIGRSTAAVAMRALPVERDGGAIETTSAERRPLLPASVTRVGTAMERAHARRAAWLPSARARSHLVRHGGASGDDTDPH